LSISRQARLGDRVVFTGRGAARLEALADADVLVYPSADEVFGLVLLEALLRHARRGGRRFGVR
jgi:glycosyltransferase involved in cell wall biosynthesis